jgi:hypothetical protein
MNFFLSVITLPFIIFNLAKKPAGEGSVAKTAIVITDTLNAAPAAISRPEWQIVYDSCRLQRYGLKKEVFQHAYTGFLKMKQRGFLRRHDLLTICDFSQSYKRKRMYVIDLDEYKLVMQSLVAHGQGSGGEYPTSFGNEFDSHKSSLGFFSTAETYYGEHGYSLRLRGRESGFNSNAYERDVVIHASEYVSDEYLRSNNKIGRSWGCPAVPEKINQKLINLIRNGSCLFIYHSSKNYLRKSSFLN